MSRRFQPPESSSPPSTPDKNGSSLFGGYGNEPSTTPAGPPPPSSAPSFTPMGEPSPSYLQSSLGGLGGNVPPINFGRQGSNSKNSSKSRPSQGSKNAQSSFGHSVASNRHQSIRPSKLSKEYTLPEPDADEDDEEDEDDGEDDPIARFRRFARDSQSSEDEEDEDADADADAMDEDDYDLHEDLMNGMEGPSFGEDSDLMMLATPAVNDRIRREAEDIFRASSMRSTAGRKRDFTCSTLAKDLQGQLGFASITESHDVILRTEDTLSSLYHDGVGEEEDEERLDDALTKAASALTAKIWDPYVDSLPQAHEEHAAKVGPAPEAPDFEKAAYVARLALQIHHIRSDEIGKPKIPPLPEIMSAWQREWHNWMADELQGILIHQPCPAAHSLFWVSVWNSLVRGDVNLSRDLLKNAAFEKVRKGGRFEKQYTGQVLTNLQRVVEDLLVILGECPTIINNNWDIRSSDWTLFRLKARAAKDALVNFAEGKDRSHVPNRFHESDFADSLDGRESLTDLARKAESRLPWDVYESLQSIYSILIGEPEAILNAAQDWCEATLGLFIWWDEGYSGRDFAASRSRSLRTSQAINEDVYLDRLASAFQTATSSDFQINPMDPVEVAIASAFEANVEAVIGFLRSWSLPIASSVAEIAALGKWLPAPEPQNLIGMESLDMEDLELLGMRQSANDEDKDGIKDSTLVQYARALRDIRQIIGSGWKGNVVRDCWEVAVQVVGRMDSPERSEDMVKELLQKVLESLDVDSSATTDKIWRLLNELGMINFAEDTAEAFGDILAQDSHRFGEALWYYALSHRPGKVRDVLNTLMSISLAESTAYPPEKELDEYLSRLLTERNVTLERLAKQDLEAAELLGKMLSGYATLRRFYELRDGGGSVGKTSGDSIASKQQAAAALSMVIASADDNIRGGLYDDTRDAVVSEDFLLALLGEATIFVHQTPSLITLDQIDILLKAIEDIQTVGSRVYEAADEFFKLVLASAPGLKGSAPTDLLSKSTSGLGGSFMMTGSSMIASQLHRSVMNSGVIKGPIKRTWDWRSNVLATTTSEDVLKRLRLGLTKDLANLWLEQADSVIL